MNNYSIAQEATSTAINSTGSSMREQEKYAQSLEGRLNRLDTAWNKVVVSVGDAVLTDGLIVGIEALNSFADTMSGVINTFGILPMVLSTVGLGIGLFSKNLRTMGTALITGTAGMNASTLATAGLQAGMTRAAVATRVLTGAIRGLAAATGIGVILAGIGFVLEKLIGKMSEAKQEQEELIATQKKNVEALTTNREETDRLIESYSKLSKQKEQGSWDIETEQEYLNIQTRLAELYPQLISHIDSSGQAHLKKVDALQEEIAYTQELIDLENKRIVEQGTENFRETVDDLRKVEKEIADKELGIKLQKGYASRTDIAGTERERAKEELYELERGLIQLQQQFATLSMTAVESVNEMANAVAGANINQDIKRIIDSFLADSSVIDSISNYTKDELDEFSTSIGQLMRSMNESFANGNDEMFNESQQALVDLFTEMGMTEMKAESLTVTTEKLAMAQNKLADSIYDPEGDLASAMDGLDENLSELDKLQTAYSNAVKGIDTLKSALDELNESHILSGDTLGNLLKDYPDLIAYIGNESKLREELTKIISEQETVAVDSLKAQLSMNSAAYTEMYNANLQYFNNLRDMYGIDVQNASNMAEAKLKAEMELLKTLTAEWSKYYNAQTDSFTEMGQQLVSSMGYQEAVNNPMLKAIGDARVQAQKISERFDDMLSDYASKSFKVDGVSSSKSSASSSSKEERYLTDLYKQKLAELNLELEKVNTSKSKYPSHSREYANHLEDEIALQEQILKLHEDEQLKLKNSIAGKENVKNNKDVDAIRDTILDLESTILTTSNSIDSLYQNLTESNLGFYGNLRDNTENYIQRITQAMELNKEDSLQYQKLSRDKINQQNHLLRLIEKELGYTQEQLNSDKLSLAYKEELKDKLNDLTNEWYKLSIEIKNTSDVLYSSIADSLGDIRDKAISSIESHYDSLIEKQQEYIASLEEEFEVQDRLLALNEKLQEMENVRNDKRFEYIDSEGNKVLTYNREKYDELKNEYDDMVKQYQREDLKKAAQQQLNYLEEQKNKAIEIERAKWEGLIKSAENGTLGFEEVMSNWYSSSLLGLSEYSLEVKTAIDTIKMMFDTLSTLQATGTSGISVSGVMSGNSVSTLGMSESDYATYLQNKANWANGTNKTQAALENQALRDKYGIDEDLFNYDKLLKFHDGGIIGSKSNKLGDLFNKLFNGNSDEQAIMALKGELAVPPKNFAQGLNRMSQLFNSFTPKVNGVMGDTIYVGTVQLVANNPNEMFNKLKLHQYRVMGS